MTRAALRRLAARLPWREAGPADVAKRRVQASLLVLLLLLAAVVAVGIVSTFDLYHSSEKRYVHVVLPLRAAMRDLVLEMVDEESGMRGYMITTDRRSLTPYFSGRSRSQADLALIARLTRGEPQLAARLQTLRTQIRELHGYYDRLITFVADGQVGRERARAEVLGNERMFSRFRQTATGMQADLDAFVQQTRAGERATFYRSVSTIGVAGVLALGIAGTLLFGVPERLRLLYAAEGRARERAEQGANAARALAHVSDAVVLVDDGGRIRSWNPAATRQFGVETGLALSRRADDVVPAYARLLAAGPEPVAIEVDGEERWLAPTTTVFDGGLVLTVRDVTAAQMLERARTDFVATASHELRTPLTSIYGAARTLLGRDDLPQERHLELLRIVEQEATHLTQIVEALLLTAELNRGVLSETAAPCDLRALCASVLAAAQTRAPAHATLVLDSPDTVRPLLCDERLVRQTLVNLVDNAIKYSPEGGRIEVRVRDEPARARIEVSDEGLGIAPSDQERIFERFYRVDAGMSRGVGGSGLGLHIAREIVARMGGALSVDSAPGRGSTFTVTLPRRDGRER